MGLFRRRSSGMASDPEASGSLEARAMGAAAREAAERAEQDRAAKEAGERARQDCAIRAVEALEARLDYKTRPSDWTVRFEFAQEGPGGGLVGYVTIRGVEIRYDKEDDTLWLRNNMGSLENLSLAAFGRVLGQLKQKKRR
jgi:hypothetical protein